MFKIQQLFEANDHPLEIKMTPKNYRQILDKKFTQLITEQEQEQIKLEQKLQEHDQLKAQLADAIRKTHQQGQVKRKKVNRQAIQQKKYELKQLEAQIEQLEDQFEEKKNYSQQNQEEVELLGKKIESLKKETDHNKDQLQRATHTVQELSQSFQGINQQHQFYKNQYIQLQQEIKNHQIRYNQLIASSAHYEQESEKLSKELQRIVPKMQAKQLKLEELENLKFRLESEINQKTQLLEEERIALKQIEDEMNKTNNNEKLIKQELKAQNQLQQERKLLLDEFHRICALSGIDKLATNSPNNENDLKQQQNQQTIEQQDVMLDQLQQDIQYFILLLKARYCYKKSHYLIGKMSLFKDIVDQRSRWMIQVKNFRNLKNKDEYTNIKFNLMISVLVDAKRSKFRQEIRRSDLKKYFGKRRIVTHSDQDQEFFQLKLQFFEDIEKEGVKIINNHELMAQLLQSQSKPAYNILSNLCSMESNEYLDILVEKYQIHKYLWHNIEGQEYNDKTVTMLSGIANLLYSSNSLLLKVAQYFLQNNIFQLFSKLASMADNSMSSSGEKVYLLRACIGIVKVVDKFQLQYSVGFQKYAYMIKIGIDWIRIDIDLSCILLLKCSKYIQNMLKLTNLEFLQHLLGQVLSAKKSKSAELIIDTFNKFIEGGDEDQIVKFFERKQVNEYIHKLCDENYDKIHKSVLDFFRILSDKDSDIIKNYCLEMLEIIRGIFDSSYDPQVWIYYAEFINNLQIEENAKYIYELIDKLIKENNMLRPDQRLELFKKINRLIGDGTIRITKDQNLFFRNLEITFDDVLNKIVSQVISKTVEI